MLKTNNFLTLTKGVFLTASLLFNVAQASSLDKDKDEDNRLFQVTMTETLDQKRAVGKKDQAFLNMVLEFKPEPFSDNGKTLLPVSQDGTFDLSNCVAPGSDVISKACLIITKDPSVFLQSKSPLSAKIHLVLIASYSTVNNYTDSTQNHPFKAIMKNWNEDTAPFGILWRFEGHPSSYYHLTARPLSDICSKNLFEFLSDYGDVGPGWKADDIYNEHILRNTDAGLALMHLYPRF